MGINDLNYMLLEKNSWLNITNQGNNKLEVNHLRSSDLSTDDEERVGGETRKYEKKISNLMNEVGTLKNEVNFLLVF